MPGDYPRPHGHQAQVRQNPQETTFNPLAAQAEKTEEISEEEKPQYRKRVKGFLRYTSWDNGEEEMVEIPQECPTVSTLGINLLQIAPSWSAGYDNKLAKRSNKI